MVKMPNNDKIISLNLGLSFNLLINTKNDLIVFGSNLRGELGVNSDYGDVANPMINSYFKYNKIKIKKVVCGSTHSIVMTLNDMVYTFGSNTYGQRGDNNENDDKSWEPFKIIIDNDIGRDIECGGYHNIILTNNNNIIAFGANDFNQCSSVNDEDRIYKPLTIDKNKEFENKLLSNYFIEKAICLSDETILIFNPNKHSKKM